MNFVERGISTDVCAACPARTRNIMTARLRGSSYRGENNVNDEANVDHCLIAIGSLVVADVMIANRHTNQAAAEHDADFIHAIFENKIETCTGPATEFTSAGVQLLCAPVNFAVDEFIKVNYEGR